MKIATLLLTAVVSFSSLGLAAPAQARSTPAPDFAALARKFREPAIPASPDGRYQIRRIGTKFLMVFEPTGAPVVVFDLSLTNISTIEMVLGGVGFGDLNLLHLIEIIKKAHQAEKDAAAIDGARAPDQPMSQGDIDKLLATANGKARDGASMFKQLRLKNGAPIAEGASFTLGDLQIKDAKAKEKFYALFAQLMNALDRANFWDRTNIEDALKEIEFRPDGKGSHYQYVWNHKARGRDDQPVLPGTVIDYYNLGYNLAYKGSLLKLSQDLQYVRNIGPIGIVIDLVVSQMTIGMVERLEYHEHEFVGLLEAMERFEYPTDEFPPVLLESTLGVLYDNFAFGNTDSDTSQEYHGERVEMLTYQEKAKAKVMEKLSKQLPASDVVTLFGGNKYAVVRNQNPGFKAIMGSALNPNWLFGFVAKHVDGKSQELKWVERELIGASAALARALLPSSFFFQIGTQNIGVSIDPMLYEQLIRGPMMNEKFMEGELVALVNEALAGRTQLPLAKEELQYVKAGLRKSLVNPYEVLAGDEDAVVEANYQLIKSIVGGRKPLRFR
jgi:hypothetical protein